MTVVRIDVTNADISNGVRLECTSCPVALAIDKLLKPIFQASVHSGYIILYRHEFHNYNDAEVIGSLDKSVRSFIKRFDINGYVEPFTFELDIPDKFLAQGGVPKGN